MKTTTKNLLVQPVDLKLGDVIKCFDGAFGTATVEQITDTEVHLFRPYVHTGDFSHTGGVTCYVGVEHFSLWRDSEKTYTLLRRVDLK